MQNLILKTKHKLGTFFHLFAKRGELEPNFIYEMRVHKRMEVIGKLLLIGAVFVGLCGVVGVAVADTVDVETLGDVVALCDTDLDCALKFGEE